MKNIFFFNSMITPKIVTFLYWLTLIAVIVSGIINMIAIGHYAGFLGGVFGGLLGIVVGLVLTRVSFELIIVVFKNNEYLRRISEKP